MRNPDSKPYANGLKIKATCVGLCICVSLMLATQVSAQTKPVNAAPTTPTATILSSNQSGTACAQQYDSRNIADQRAILEDNRNANIATGVAIAADAAGWLVEAAAAATLIGTPAGIIANAAAQAIALTSSGVALGYDVAAYDKGIALATQDETVNGLPNCDSEFAGTVKVTAGGTDVTGDSIFKNNLGVVGDVNVGGQVTATNLAATRGVSAAGGDLRLGKADGTGGQPGITMGNGVITGLGAGSALGDATTLDKDAVAIGNGSLASTSTSTAVGAGAQSTQVNSTAIGAGAKATGVNSTALGADAQATALNTTAVGSGSRATAEAATALGQNAQATALNATALGQKSLASGEASTATGQGSKATAFKCNGDRPEIRSICRGRYCNRSR